MECGGCTAPSGPGFRRVLWVALALNAAMFAVELIASVISGSMALQADALDFLGDSLNYALSLLVAGMALQVRAGAAVVKGVSMGAFGVWVLGSTVHRVLAGAPPEPALMGAVGALALVVNVGVAWLLFAYRAGDSNMRSVWLCSRNDAFANVAVIVAAVGVHATATRWPDLAVAGLIAGLSLSASSQVLRQAAGELRASRGAMAS